MTPTAITLLSFVAWTLLLVISLGILRSSIVMATGRAANSFSASGEDLEGIGQRLTRVHANCYENLPVAGAVLLYAIASSQTGVTDGLAYIFLGARIAQSITHIISTSKPFVLIRFALYIVQTGILIFWLLKFFGVL